jgi:hypothetical protein
MRMTGLAGIGVALVFSTSIRPPIPRTFGHPFHDDPATYSTVIRPV